MPASAWIEDHEASAPAWRNGEVPTRPRYALTDFVALLWRERLVMIAVFVVIAALGLAAALTLKTAYPAHSSLLIRLGQEYVYEPRVGDAGRGVTPDPDQVIQAEVEILSSAQLKERVIQKLGIGRLLPGSGATFDRATPAG